MVLVPRQNDLASMLIGFHQRMSSGSITRREAAVDDRADLTLLNERPDLGTQSLRLWRP